MARTVYCLKNRTEDHSGGAGADPYETALGRAVFVPIMHYEPIHLSELVRAVSANHDALIVTSQRAVDALSSVLPKLPSRVFEIPTYTVGPATAERLKRLRFAHVFGSDSGNGIALAKQIICTSSGRRKFLFLAGEIHRRQLPDMLVSAGNEVDTLIVYKTVPANVEIEPRPNPTDWIVFFSPSHADGIVADLRQLHAQGMPTPKVAAIGPTTQEYLQSQGLAVDAVARTPTAEGLKCAIDESDVRDASCCELLASASRPSAGRSQRIEIE